MSIFRVSYLMIMVTVVFSSMKAMQPKVTDVPTKKPGLMSTMLNVYPYALVGTIVADKVCDEDEDYKKAVVESLFVSLGSNKHQREVFITNIPFNWGVRKGIRYANSKGITLKAVGHKCDVVPKDWVTTRNVVNSTAKGIAKQFTEPQFITEIAKFVVFSYVAKK
jgi:hypothetical protein